MLLILYYYLERKCFWTLQKPDIQVENIFAKFQHILGYPPAHGKGLIDVVGGDVLLDNWVIKINYPANC